MFLRKLYLKIRIFLYSIKDFVNKTVFILVIASLLYFFVNFIVFQTIILGKANQHQNHNNYPAAVKLYKIAYLYYGFNNFSGQNQKIFLELPYRIAMCYLEEGEKENSVKIMLQGLTAVQDKYGYFSKENAYFIRKYLIKYFFIINNIKLAKQEFTILFDIYKKININQNDLAELLLLRGILYDKQNNYEQAIIFYEKAYTMLLNQTSIDYDVFSELIENICAYQIKTNQADAAINTYKQSIIFLKTFDVQQAELIASMLISLGNLYANNDIKTKEAITCYEEALGYIKKLPKTNSLKQNFVLYLKTLQELYNKDNQFHKAKDIDVELARQRRFGWLF